MPEQQEQGSDTGSHTQVGDGGAVVPIGSGLGHARRSGCWPAVHRLSAAAGKWVRWTLCCTPSLLICFGWPGPTPTDGNPLSL